MAVALLLLLSLSPVHAGPGAAGGGGAGGGGSEDVPNWPEGGWLSVGTTQLLYDRPAQTTEELLRRDGLHGVSLHWPEAEDDGRIVAYRVLREGVLVATVPASERRVFEAEVKGEITWSVVAVDDAGQASEPLSATSVYRDPFTGTGTLVGQVSVVLGSEGEGGTLGAAELEPAELDAIHRELANIFAASPGVASTSELRVSDPGGEGVSVLGTAEELGLGGDAAGIAAADARPDLRVSMRAEAVRHGGAAAPEAVDRVVQRYKGQLRYCVERVPEVGLPLRATVRLDLAETGRVTSVEVQGLAAEQEVKTCFEGKLRRWRFPMDHPGEVRFDLHADEES